MGKGGKRGSHQNARKETTFGGAQLGTTDDFGCGSVLKNGFSAGGKKLEPAAARAFDITGKASVAPIELMRRTLKSGDVKLGAPLLLSGGSCHEFTRARRALPPRGRHVKRGNSV